MSDPPSPNRGGTPPELAVAEVIGRLMHFWGFKRPMGRVWAILYLSPQALTASDLADELQMSAGAISMALTELEKWGAVRRNWTPGDRRDFFSAETDIWSLVQRVMKERELTLIREFGRTLTEADAALSRAEHAAGERSHGALGESRDIEYKRRRVEQLRQLSESGEMLLSALVAGAPINPSVLLKNPRPSLKS